MEELKPRPATTSPLTPLNFLERAATVYGHCTSIIYNETSYTWSETHRRCLQLASSLSSTGVQRGQVVSVLAPNIPAMYELHFAVPMTGCILNTINTRLDARTVSVILRHGEPKVLFVDILSVSLVLEAISLFPADAKPPMLVLINDDEYAYTENSNSSIDSRFCCTYESLVERGNPSFSWVRPRSEWNPIVLNYTSGTTSSPKGVVNSHRGIFLAAVNSLVEWEVPKQPVYLWALPMFHSNGWCLTWAMAAVGGINVCVRKFNPEIIFTLIRKHGVTHMCAAPVVLNMLSNSPDAKPLESPVRIQTGGAPPPADVLFRTESLGFIVSHVYGLTETGGVVVTCAWKREWNRLPAAERARLKARQGVRIAGVTEVDVVNSETGQSVKRDGSTLGEIVLRGPSVMLGYYKDPDSTNKCLKQDGWLYTGDVGVIHPDGYLEIKDRSKDVIISGGENLSSVEVESILYSHPAVNEAAVVAQPDEHWGETPCAFVSLKGDDSARQRQPSEKEIMEYCRAKLPHYMAPKTVVFMGELPKTSTGKIQKFALREIAKGLNNSSSRRMSRM